MAVFAFQVTLEVGRDLVEVGDFPEAIFRVIGQTDVEEAGVFLSDESVHVGAGWSDQQQVVFVEQFGLALLGLDHLSCLKQFFVLVIRELVIPEFGV